jgi:hypothetical protein
MDQIFVIKSSRARRSGKESDAHKMTKASCAAAELMSDRYVIEEYPVGDGRYTCDLAVFNTSHKLLGVVEVVHTSPPSSEKLEYYAMLGIKCTCVSTKGYVVTEEQYKSRFALPSTYKYKRKTLADGSDYGRTYVKHSGGCIIGGEWRPYNLQGCPRHIRKELAGETYTDVDMKGAAPRVLIHVCSQMGVDAPMLQYVVDDIGRARASIAAELGVPKEEAKELINRTLHGGTEGCKGHVLHALRAEMAVLANALRADETYALLVDKSHSDGSLISLVWQTLEHKCLVAALGIVGYDKRIVALFDGMLLPNDLVSDSTIAAMQAAMQAFIQGMEFVVEPW